MDPRVTFYTSLPGNRRVVEQPDEQEQNIAEMFFGHDTGSCDNVECVSPDDMTDRNLRSEEETHHFTQAREDKHWEVSALDDNSKMDLKKKTRVNTDQKGFCCIFFGRIIFCNS